MNNNPSQILMMLLDDLAGKLPFETFPHPITDEVALAVEKKHAECCGLTVEIALSRHIMATVTIVNVKVDLKVKGVHDRTAYGRLPYLTPKRGQESAEYENDALRSSIPMLVSLLIKAGPQG